jgi:hypothetical protein
LEALGELVVAGGDPSPLFEFVVAPLDHIAPPVQVGVEGGWSPAAGALLGTSGLLVLFFRDDGLDLAFAQVGAVGTRAVGLVPGDRVRP